MDIIIKILGQPVVAIILLLGILILAHEFGHFVVGKLCGIAVEIFSIGFGPVLFRIRVRDTEFRLSGVPLGGFVKFYGATRSEEVPKGIRGKPFYNSPLWARFLTIAAGPFFNFILAAITYLAMGMYGIPQLPPVIGEVMHYSPAERAGLRFGDRILNINQEEIKSWADVQQFVGRAARQPLDLVVQRQNASVIVKIIPDSVQNEDDLINENRGQIGITPGRSPSFLTLADANGVAAKSGLMNGDQINGVSLGSGKEIKVEYWQQFLSHVKEARQLGLDKITLYVARTVDKNNGPPESQSIELNLTSLPRQGLQTDSQIEGILGIRDSQLTVKSVEQGVTGKSVADEGAIEQKEFSPTARAVSYQFLKPGDVILKWEGSPLHDLFQYSKLAASSLAPRVNLEIQRGSTVRNILVDLQRIELQRAEGRVVRYRLPVSFLGEFKQPDFIIEKYGFLSGINFGYQQTLQQTKMVAKAVGGLFTGVVPLKALGGPISIGKVASDSVKLGWMTFLAALAMISINLGLLNLVPIPVLDGGQVVLLIAEGIYRRPLPDAIIESFQKIGFVMVLALVIMATYNDISRFWVSMVESVIGYFQ